MKVARCYNVRMSAIQTGNGGNGLLQGIDGVGGMVAELAGVTLQSLHVGTEFVGQIGEALLGSINQVSSVAFDFVSEGRDSLTIKNTCFVTIFLMNSLNHSSAARQ